MKYCIICKGEFDGYKTTKICSLECKKISRSNADKKYNDKYKKHIDFNNIDKIDGEEWKQIEDYDYYISNKGRVISKNGLMKPAESKNGYLYICLCKNGIQKTFSLHRLIAKYFIFNNNENNNIIDHIDRNRKNNNLENLRWVNYKENALNSKSVINRKCSKWIDKCVKNNNVYEYWRVQYYDNNIKKRKRFKTEEEANEFINNFN